MSLLRIVGCLGGLLGWLGQPVAARAGTTPTPIKDLVYGQAGDTALKLDLYQPETASNRRRPVIVFLHGGGWRIGSKQEGAQVAGILTRAGFAVASIDYRLSGQAIFPAQIQDAKTAVRWLRANAARYALDPRRIGALGFSAGGHLAALLGTSAGDASLEGRGEGSPRESSRVQAVCDVSGPTDLSLPSHSLIGPFLVRGELGGPASAKPALVRAANPVTYVSGDEPPFLVIQGDRDKLVIPEHAALLVAALRRAGRPVTFLTVHGGGHVPFAPAQADAMLRFFEQTLGASRHPAGQPPSSTPGRVSSKG